MRIAIFYDSFTKCEINTFFSSFLLFWTKTRDMEWTCPHLREHDLQCISHGTECMYSPHRTWSQVPPSWYWVCVLTSQNMVSSASLILLSVCTHLTEHGLQHLPGCAECVYSPHRTWVSSTSLMLLSVCTHLTEHGLQCLPYAAEYVYSPHRTWSPAPAWFCWICVLTSQNMISSASLMVQSVCTYLTEHGLQHLPGCPECVYSPQRTWSPAPAWLCWICVLTSQNMISSASLMVQSVCTYLTEHGLQHLPGCPECVYSPQRTWSPAPSWLCWMRVLTSQNMVSSTCLIVLNACTHLTEHGSPAPPSCCWVHVLTSQNMVSSTCLVVLNACTHLTEHGLQHLPGCAECVYSPHRTWSPVPPSWCWVHVLTSQNMVSSASLMLLSTCTNLREHGLQHLPGCAEYVYSPHRTWSPVPPSWCWVHGLQCLPHAAECVYSPQRKWSPAPAWLWWICVLTSQNMVSSASLMVLSVCTYLTEHGLQCLPHGTECVYSPHRTWSPVPPSCCWVSVLTSQNMVSSASLMVLSACTHLREHGLQCLPHAAECMYSPQRTWSPAPAWLSWMCVLTWQNMGLQHLPHAAECVYSPQRTWSLAPAWLCWMRVLTSENMVSSTCLVVLNVCTHLTEHGSPAPPSCCWVCVLTWQNMVSSTCLVVLNVCTHLTEHGLQCLPHTAESMYSPQRTWSPAPAWLCWMRVLTSQNMVSSTCLVVLNMCTHLTEHGSPAPPSCCWVHVLTSQNMVSSTCLVVLNACTHLTEHGLQCLPHAAECVYSPHRTWSPAPAWLCWICVLTSQNMVSSASLMVQSVCTYLTEHGLQHLPGCAECMYSPQRTWSPAPVWLCWMCVLTS